MDRLRRIQRKNQAFDALVQAGRHIDQRRHRHQWGSAGPVPASWLAWRAELAANYEAMKAELHAQRSDLPTVEEVIWRRRTGDKQTYEIEDPDQIENQVQVPPFSSPVLSLARLLLLRYCPGHRQGVTLISLW